MDGMGRTEHLIAANLCGPSILKELLQGGTTEGLTVARHQPVWMSRRGQRLDRRREGFRSENRGSVVDFGGCAIGSFT